MLMPRYGSAEVAVDVLSTAVLSSVPSLLTPQSFLPSHSHFLLLVLNFPDSRERPANSHKSILSVTDSHVHG